MTSDGFKTMPPPKKPPIYIFDLDGTLADCTHRLPYITGGDLATKDWDAFFLACPDDTPIEETCGVARRLADSGAEIWIWTGRSSIAQFDTQRWLKKHTIWYDELRGRIHGDHTPDDKLKRQWLHELDDDVRARIAGVFEDRKRVVDMWREEGLTCYHVAPGDF